MKYTKYILIVIALYFGIGYHNEYSNTEKEIRSIEDGFKNELDLKSKEYSLNSENISFKRDSVSLLIDQKYLILVHDIEIQYLRGNFDIKIYNDRMQGLKKSELKETSENIESWLTEYEGNTLPKTPFPELLIERRESSGKHYRLSFMLGGLMAFFFLFADVLTWLKDRRQLKYPIRVNKPHSPLNKQDNKRMVYDGQTLTRQKVQLEDSEVLDEWIGEDGNPVEVPVATTAIWDKVHELTDNNQMRRDGKLLTRLSNGNGEYEGGEFWIDENDQTQEVSSEEITDWEKSKIS